MLISSFLGLVWFTIITFLTIFIISTSLTGRGYILPSLLTIPYWTVIVIANTYWWSGFVWLAALCLLMEIAKLVKNIYNKLTKLN